MALHIIQVALLNSTTVDTLQSHNPLETVPGDTVAWRFRDAQEVAITNAEIEFRGFLPASGASPTGPERQPFITQLSIPHPMAGRFTVADTDRGLYLYVIILNGQVLNWPVPLLRAGSFGPFFGGIIIRDPRT